MAKMLDVPDERTEPTTLYIQDGEEKWGQCDENDITIDLVCHLRNSMAVRELIRFLHISYLHEYIHWLDIRSFVADLSERNVDIIILAMEAEDDLAGQSNIVRL